jgi:hypothetical protein
MQEEIEDTVRLQSRLTSEPRLRLHILGFFLKSMLILWSIGSSLVIFSMQILRLDMHWICIVENTTRVNSLRRTSPESSRTRINTLK